MWLALVRPTARRMDALHQHIAQNLAQPLTLPLLAERIHVSERQLACLFKTELRTIPAAYIESVRVEVARNRLETTDEPLERIATACGLHTTDTLTRAFRRQLNTTPAEYRIRFRTS